MFRYIDMPKLVAYYLKEFSVRNDGTPSNMYKFIFCLCLPFISQTFNSARMNALAIAECTTSRDQISRVLKKITGADVSFTAYLGECFIGYDGTNDQNQETFIYGKVVFGEEGSESGDIGSLDGDNPVVPYEPVPNAGNMVVALNGFGQEQFESYLSLLIPFYISFNITYV